jgi:hypothetical protein
MPARVQQGDLHFCLLLQFIILGEVAPNPREWALLSSAVTFVTPDLTHCWYYSEICAKI